jgi:hypothetical protein
VPVWRGVLVTPAEAEWIVQSCAADLTSRSLQKKGRRGTLVVPAKSQWIIQRCAPDARSASLRERRVWANRDLPLFNRARTGDLPVNKPQTQALRMLPERDEMLLILVSFRV